MPQLIGLARLGKDAELRYTPKDSQPVASLALAFNYGRKGDDGNRPTQWVDAAMWGERAEKLAEYLLKGQPLFVVVDEVHIETYETRDGRSGSKLVGRVSTLEFAGPNPNDSKPAAQGRAPAPAPRAPAAQRQAPAPRSQGGGSTSTGFDDLDDDIPF